MQFPLLGAFGRILAPSEETTSPRLKCFTQTYVSLQRSRNGSKLENNGCQYIMKRNSLENAHRSICTARQFTSSSRMKYKLSLSRVCFYKGCKIDFRIFIIFTCLMIWGFLICSYAHAPLSNLKRKHYF